MTPTRPTGAIRIVHTSDWHLGVELGPHSRRPDHLAAIASLEAICADYRPDVIIHTGDLFDHARPSAEDQAVAVAALGRLSAIAPVVVVAGNHDNGPMLDRVWGPLSSAGDARVHFRGRLRAPGHGGAIRIPAAGGAKSLVVCTMPFVTPHSFAKWKEPGETTLGFTAGIKRVHDQFDQWLADNTDQATDKVIWAAHLLVAGARPAGSERKVHLADDYATSAQHIPPHAYAAFGHIHIPQELPGNGTGRYAGSMIPISFDEARAHQPAKSVVLVELPATGAPRTELASLDTGRPLIVLNERLEHLAAQAEGVKGALVRVRVPLDAPMPGLSALVAGALPDALIVEVHGDVTGGAHATPKPTAHTEDLEGLLERWLGEHPLAGGDSERTAGIIRTLVAAATTHRRIPLGGEELLDRDIAADLAAEITSGLDWLDSDAEAAVIESLLTEPDAVDGAAT